MPTTIQVSFNFDGEYSPLIQTDNADNGPDSYYSGYKIFANSTFLEIAYGDGTGAGSDDRRTALASNLLLEEGIYTHPKLAVWFGNETKGISQEAIDNSEFCIQMTMGGIVESMNLSVSTGIILYNIASQRRKYLKNKFCSSDSSPLL